MNPSFNLKTFLTHILQKKFQNQDSYTPILEHPLAEKSNLEKSIEILQESALQFQKSSSQSIDRLET